MTFTPAQIGPRTASITISDNAPRSPQSVALGGTGVVSGPNVTLSATSLTFADQSVGTTSPAQPVTLSNYGTSTLAITGIAASGDFSQSSPCGSALPPLATCTISVTFSPTQNGRRTGTLSITDNAPGSPQTVTLTGTGANAVPLINQPLVPEAIAPGGAGFNLTVNGAGFFPASVVKWNGSPRATTFVSPLRLKASILGSDIAQARTAFVTVVNPSPGGGTSNVAFFQVASPRSSVPLSPPSSYTAGSGPDTVAVGDFNGDGKLDLAVANNVSNNVSVLLGKGDGTFHAAVNYGAGTNPTSVAVGDFNGDRKLDLAVANWNGNDVSILLGNGDGTFQPAVNYNVTFGPQSVAVGDFNGDGKLDLAVANYFGEALSILLGNGDGTFQAHVNYQAGSGPVWVAVGDFNGDGRLDFAVTDFDGSGGPGSGVLVSILLQTP